MKMSLRLCYFWREKLYFTYDADIRKINENRNNRSKLKQSLHLEMKRIERNQFA